MAVVDTLSVEIQQEVEIARAVSSDARLLILDEATSSLSEAATQRLLEVVEEQRSAGVAVS
jgi:ABC-type sugar transport system ATPase subunit